jgi:hypothetical protein
MATIACGSGQPGAAARTAARPAAADAAPVVATVADVKLDLIQRPVAALAPPGRDPFQFRAVASVASGARSGGAPVLPAPVPAAPAPTGPPPLPLIPLRYIGVIDTPDQPGRVAMLSDGRGGLMQGREGDIIEGRYRVLKVGLDTLEIAYADGRGRQTLRLSGQ